MREWLLFLVECGIDFLATSPDKSAHVQTNVHVTEMLRNVEVSVRMDKFWIQWCLYD